MNNKNKQWKPKIINLRKVFFDGQESWEIFSTDGYTIPAGHSYYSIIKNINNKQLKGA